MLQIYPPSTVMVPLPPHLPVRDLKSHLCLSYCTVLTSSAPVNTNKGPSTSTLAKRTYRLRTRISPSIRPRPPQNKRNRPHRYTTSTLPQQPREVHRPANSQTQSRFR